MLPKKKKNRESGTLFPKNPQFACEVWEEDPSCRCPEVHALQWGHQEQAFICNFSAKGEHSLSWWIQSPPTKHSSLLGQLSIEIPFLSARSIHFYCLFPHAITQWCAHIRPKPLPLHLFANRQHGTGRTAIAGVLLRVPHLDSPTAPYGMGLRRSGSTRS